MGGTGLSGGSAPTVGPLEADSIHGSGLPVVIDSGKTETVTLHVVVERSRFESGRATVTLRVRDDDGFERDYGHHVLGPLFGGGAASAGEES